MSTAKQFKRKAETDKTADADSLASNEHFVGTGSTLLNLALSDRVDGGWLTGHGVHIIGDSNTGKSLEALTILAEAAHDPWFDDYLLEDFDRESSRAFDVLKLFGKKTAERITQAPFMQNIEEWNTHVHKLLDKGEPFVHVLDSFDALTSKAEMEAAEARVKGNIEKGSYGTEKAKASSAFFRQLVGKLEHSKSLLVLISQTRDDINPMSFAAASNRKYSGGNALTFYGHQRVFLAVKGSIKSRNRAIGSNVVAKVARTRVTGKQRTVEFPVYYDYGIDDIGSMVDFLTIQNDKDDGIWNKSKNSIVAEDFDLTVSRDKLIRTIEEEGWEDKLKQLTSELWHEIEDSLKLNRKNKYPTGE
jgi:RecA/RadA recombinase